jgi:ABC-type phosphate/phosphonate transport system permease subunit
MAFPLRSALSRLHRSVATTLGLVGAGGIGLELTTAMRMHDYGHLSTIIICVIVLVTLIDQGSALIRRRITCALLLTSS